MKKKRFKTIPRPDIICLGYDQKYFIDNLKEKLRQRGLDIEIVRIQSFKPSIYKSSKLRNQS